MYKIMSRNKQKKIHLTKFISKNLLLRDSANELFNYINEIKTPKIIVNFNNIQSITRAFTHQYLLNKKSSNKNIIDVNISPHVKKMFELIERSDKNFNFR